MNGKVCFRMFLKPLLILALIVIAGCDKSVMAMTQTNDIETLAKGADVSWLPQMEKAGFVFYNEQGEPEDLLKILKTYGINSIRLRTWVNPSDDLINGHCSTTETVEMAKRAKAMGFRIMIDFHYSDSWSDPGKQIKPAAWVSHGFSELLTDVYSYTKGVMSDLKNAGVTPEWVQVGNEINPGMLLPDGSSTNMPALAQLINEGYRAVKEVSSNTLVVIHLANGSKNSLFRWFFDGLTQNHAKYDVIGLSYYPYWDGKPYTETIDLLATNLNDMVDRYHKPVMIVETGGLDTEPETTFNMLKVELDRIKAVSQNMGLGVFYWEPEGASSWSGYHLSCWQTNGQPTTAVKAFLDE